MPAENLSKVNVKIAYFSVFLQAEMISSAAASRQDLLKYRTKITSIIGSDKILNNTPCI